MRQKKYYGIEPIAIAGSSALNELEISVDYDKGGWNCFNGNIDKRGVYVYLKPLHRSGGVTQSVMLGSRVESGFKVFVKELGRMSQKQVDNIASKVFAMGKEIAEHYDNRDFAKIASMIRGVEC